MTPHRIDSAYAWVRLVFALALMTIGNGAMYIVVVVLPAVQAEFAISRAGASLPYTLMMAGFALGGLFMGRLADRHGVFVPLLVGAAALGAGFILAARAGGIGSFALAHGLLLGFLGCGSLFGPLIADTSLWFERRRGIAVAVCASGNYLAGAVWPPIVQHFVESAGWRDTYFGIGAFTAIAVAALALAMRERPPALAACAAGAAVAPAARRPFDLSPRLAQALLCIAGLACCVAMSMPQVHIVAWCGDLGYGPARGAQMLSVMLAFGIVSRLVSGWICDHIGGLRTLLLGSALQGLALLLFLPYEGIAWLFAVSALFGLFQGGIVPSYAIIVREHFAPGEAGARLGAILMMTLLGMALGGSMSGLIFDLTGSYRAAFVNGVAWSLLNFTIALVLLRRAGGSVLALAGTRGRVAG
ncbi:MAG: MFS transporter [Burkholderiales bacterium]|nr:MFS transporter [Burkholderiales bacterium]